mgnify:CR=1 FL=1
MLNNVEKMTTDYTPNFNLNKRTNKKIKYIILHYTGMKTEKSAINRLTNCFSNVSCHYFITNKGKIIQMLPDNYIAWHAGLSSWKKHKLLNQYSIGIEISNPGHQYGYKNFNRNQIKSVIQILKKLLKKYKINKTNILGHSDIAPLRKKDPGEKFPWKKLASNKLGIWHNVPKNICKKFRLCKLEKSNFIKELKTLGYNTNYKNKNELKKIVKSFQRRYRPELVNGFFDYECLQILKSLKSNKY